MVKEPRDMLLMRRPDFKYLNYCSTKEDVKAKFKELALQFHPDRGGDVREMQQLNVEYQYINKVNPLLPIDKPVFTQRPQQPPRPNTPPPPPPITNILDWETFKMVVDTMLVQIKSAGKSETSLYFNYIDFIIANNLKTSRKQLEYIAIVLKYKSGWAFYKEQDLRKQNLIL
jgi:hypothetical protein